jgi:DNA helicase-2/ATP-dependent DNA helicase PcrA
MPASIPSYLEVLNPEQREAVLHEGKPLLILAGAGSGKTRVITTKIAYLIREKGVDPRSILAVTFTNKAAREMADRARLIDGRAGDAMLRTFHSFGAWFLRRNGRLGGLEPGFVIYDEDDAIALLGTIMEGAPRAEIRAMSNKITRAKDYFLSPDDPELDLIDHSKIFKAIYKKYEEKLSSIGNVDFGDLIRKPVEILRSEGDVARRFRERFRVILVDEYQDANIAQAELLKELYSPGAYLCVVGDDDQSIYRFRGAEVRNILEFPDCFMGADIIRLERNYRSTTPILRAAASVVDHNQGRLGKKLKSERGDGKAPVLAFLPDQDTESEFCANLILKYVGNGGTYSEWAIVYRTNAQSLGFETEFLRRKIPYRVVGSLKFYEREEVKDTLALLSFLVNPRDEIAFRRVVNKPSRGVGPATMDRIIEEAASPRAEREGRGNLLLAARQLAPELSAKARSGIAVFLKAIEAGRNAISEAADNSQETTDSKPKTVKNKKPSGVGGLRSGEGLSECVVRLAVESGLAEYYIAEDEIAGNQRLSNLQEVANAASLYAATEDGLLEFLEHIELDRSMEEASGPGTDAVTLITLHNTKGLEFRRVIMTGIEQGIFPRDDKKGEDLEEERRLFYVGATRAMDELYLTSCAYRRMYGRTESMEPSLFLKEIDHKGLRIIGSVPYGFTALGGHQRGGKSQAGFQGGKPGSQPPVTSDGRWALGDRVFHDDHGYGQVTRIQEGDDGPVVKVVFETGYEMRFLSLHQSSRFTKISD